MADTKTNKSNFDFVGDLVDNIGGVWSDYINGKSQSKVAEYNAQAAEAYAEASKYSTNNQTNTSTLNIVNVAIAVVAIVVVVLSVVIIKKTLL